MLMASAVSLSGTQIIGNMSDVRIRRYPSELIWISSDRFEAIIHDQEG
jgi:hypothetical protein